MNRALTISLTLNLTLAGWLIFILARQSIESSGFVPTARLESGQPTATVAMPVGRQVEPKPFQWSQLESTDYRIYIRNLRSIGCPEPTLRAIVTTDVDVDYRHRSEKMERKLADIAGSSWAVQLSSFNEQQALKAELQKLPSEEDSEIADLLGITSSTTIATDVSTEAFSTRCIRHGLKNTPIVNPLVFQNIDLSVIDLNEQQIQAVQNLRQSFVDEIGGPNQDPNDPAYRERWQNAQPEMDNLLQGILGATAFEKYLLAARESTPDTVAGGP